MSESESELFYFVSIHHRVTVTYTNGIFKYANMDAPIKTISGRHHKATMFQQYQYTLYIELHVLGNLSKIDDTTFT